MRTRAAILSGVALCGLVVLLSAQGPPAGVPNWPQGMRWAFGYEAGGADVDQDGNIRAQNLTVGGTIIGFDGMIDPGGTNHFIVSVDGEDWLSLGAASSRVALGFLFPILDRRSPGTFGLVTPSMVGGTSIGASDLMLVYDMEATLPEVLDELDEVDEEVPFVLDGRLFGAGSIETVSDGFAAHIHQGSFQLSGGPWVNRLKTEWGADLYLDPLLDPAEAGVIDTARVYQYFRSQGAENTLSIPHFYLNTRGQGVFFPSNKAVANTHSDGPDWFNSAITVGGGGMILRSGHSITFGIKPFTTTDSESFVYVPDEAHEHTNDPRDPDFVPPDLTGGKPDHLLAHVMMNASSNGNLVVNVVDGANGTTIMSFTIHTNEDSGFEIGDVEFGQNISANNYPLFDPSSAADGDYVLLHSVEDNEITDTQWVNTGGL